MKEGEDICGDSTFLQQVLALTACDSVRLQNTAEILWLSPLGLEEPLCELEQWSSDSPVLWAPVQRMTLL